MMDVTSLQWTCGAWWHTAVLSVHGNNFPDKLLHLVGNQLSPARVMPSANGQSLAINIWLLSSAGRLLAPDLLIRESDNQCCCCLVLQCEIQHAYNWSWLLRAQLRALQIPAAFYPPSCLRRVTCAHPSSETSCAWFLPLPSWGLFMFGIVKGAWGMQHPASTACWSWTILHAVWKVQVNLTNLED